MKGKKVQREKGVRGVRRGRGVIIIRGEEEVEGKKAQWVEKGGQLAVPCYTWRGVGVG